MRIKSIKLTNYIGIYNGMGLNELYINFDNGRHKTVVIKGKNGSGKSTLFSTLHPLPDSNSSLIPNLPAEKNIVISDNDIIFNILIKHPIKDNGERATTKAYIEKICPISGKLQLNPNGNVSSFKEILFSEFSLDPNFVSLSQLSGDDRGLADKTPAERKKFVNSIINNLSVYNDIHKSLTKRSSVFKSMMNTLVSKIDSIGDREKLKLTLVSLENRLNGLMNEKEIYISQLANSKSKISILDPDGSIQNTYDMIYKELIAINNEIESIDNKIKVSLKKLKLSEDIKKEELSVMYNDIKDICLKLETDTTILESEISVLLSNRESESKSLQTKNARLLSLQSDNNYEDIDTEISNTRLKINSYMTMLKEVGIRDLDSISRDEYILGLNTLKEIKDSIDVFRSSSEYSITSEAIKNIKNNIYPDINIIDEEIEKIDKEIDFFKEKVRKYTILSEVASKLEYRPKECTIDNCSFIEDSLKASLENPQSAMIVFNSEIDVLNAKRLKLVEYRNECNKIIDCMNYLKSLCRNIEKSAIILDKLPISNIFKNRNDLLQGILEGHSFEEIDILYNFIDYANIIDECKLEIIKLKELESDYKVYKSKSIILKDLILDIEELDTKINELSIKITSSNETIKDNKIKLVQYKTVLKELEVILSLVDNKEYLELNTKHELNSKFNVIKSSIIEIKEQIQIVNNLESKLKEINKQIPPIIEDRDKINHGLSLLSEYERDLELYKTKYKKIEIIKKYSSPNKGIQTLFMELYMNKTLSMANELLGLLFDGEYILGQFEINESEFRIPCIGSGLTNNDISSMSTSQICMISMILSFVMLQQSSTKYNILKLDEIDGGLDTRNRLQFLHVLEELMVMLNVEQCIMISHNTEMDLSNCDIIQLKLNEGEVINDGNIIFKY